MIDVIDRLQNHKVLNVPSGQQIQIYNVGSPIDPTDTANKAYVDNQIGAISGGNSLWQVSGTATNLITADEINLLNFRIINVSGPSDNKDAVNKEYVDSGLAWLSGLITTVSGADLWQISGAATQLRTNDEVNMQGYRIINVMDPANAQDAATKNYVDLHTSGEWVKSIQCETGTISATGINDTFVFSGVNLTTTGSGKAFIVSVPIADLSTVGIGFVSGGTNVTVAYSGGVAIVAASGIGIANLWQTSGAATQLITADEINMRNMKIINLDTPVSPSDAVTKAYVDTISGGMSTGAPTDATYVTLSLTGSLSAERVFKATSGVSLTDTGANGSIILMGIHATTTGIGVASFSDTNFEVNTGVVAVKNGGIEVSELNMNATLNMSGNKITNLGSCAVLSDAATKGYVDEKVNGISGVGAPTTAQYVTLALDSTLSAERVLRVISGLAIQDTGANGSTIIYGTDATTSAKGIASFDTNNFSVSAGAVSVKAGGIDVAEMNINANLNISGNKVINSAEPAASADLTTKNYVDSKVASGTGASTKEFFIPAYGTSNVNVYAFQWITGGFGTCKVNNQGGTGDIMAITFLMPHDYNSLSKAAIIGTADKTTGSANIDLTVSTTRVGSSLGVDVATDSGTSWTFVSGVVYEMDISGLFNTAGIGASDYVGIKIDNQDTWDCELQILGAHIKYT